MIFHEKVEEGYRAQLFKRYDDTGLLKYFAPEEFEGLNFTPYSFMSSKGCKLQGYFYSYDGADRSRLIIFDHGVGGGHRSYMKEIERICREGYYVFSYDHIGCMESEGDSICGFSQSVCDLNDCIKALKADETVNTSDISVIGHSWGGFATMNIPALHTDVKKVVVLSGFVSVPLMIEQNFSGLLRGYRKDIMRIERESNPEFVELDGRESLACAKTQALMFYSDDDKMVHKNVHYDALLKALGNNENVELVLVSGKGHNPNYTYDAVKALGELGARLKEAVKLQAPEEKEVFKNSFDWDKMTEQDEEIFKRIFDFLK